MEIGDTLYVTTRDDWRAWLEANHATASGIWLIGYRKHAGRPSLDYAAAVEEALCFGWIDSTRKRLDDDRYAQRFTPRRPGSGYSQPNIERLRRLATAGRLEPDVHASVEDLLEQEFEWPADVLESLRADERAWRNFQQFPEPYRRIRVAFVDAARGRPEEFQKRLANLVRKCAQGKKFGYGIEAFY